MARAFSSGRAMIIIYRSVPTYLPTPSNLRLLKLNYRIYQEYEDITTQDLFKELRAINAERSNEARRILFEFQVAGGKAKKRRLLG
jgi:hypothetical protein